jgi:hypothetical protein
VIFSDEGLVQIQVLLRRNCSLEEYENLTYLRDPELSRNESVRYLVEVLSKRQIVNLGDVQNAYRIRDNLRARRWDVTTRHARLVNARDFRTGDFVILGSSFSNPWASLFDSPATNFPLEEPKPQGRAPAYLNRNPLPGEPMSFGVRPAAGGAKTVTHALVSLTNNVTRTGRVVLIAGQSLSATEMAGEFLFRKDSVARIRRALRLSGGSPLPNLEMVLRVTEVNQVGDSVDLAACRVLPGASE